MVPASSAKFVRVGRQPKPARREHAQDMYVSEERNFSGAFHGRRITRSARTPTDASGWQRHARRRRADR